MVERENRKYEVEIRTGDGDDKEKRAWLTLNLLNVEKQKSEEIVSAVEALKVNIEEILTR